MQNENNLTEVTYGAAFADVYDEWYGDDPETTSTVQLLADLVAHTPRPRVLELGAGTGRLAIPLAATLRAQSGVVVALDESAEMLRILASNAAQPPSGDNGASLVAVHASMVDLASLSRAELNRAEFGRAELSSAELSSAGEEAFHLIYASYNTFFNLSHDGEQERCLAAVAQHLHRDGLFVLDAFIIASDAPTHGSSHEQRGAWTLHTSTIYEPATGLIDGSTRSSHRDGRNVQRPWRIRYQSPTQLDALCDKVGMKLTERYSSWQKSTFDHDAARHVSIYRLVR